MKLLSELASYLAMVPDVIWAALIASVLTFGGVLLQLRSSRKEQLQTLAHDAKQRDREREMSLRRDVFIPAADAVSRLQNILGIMFDLNAQDKAINDSFREATATLSKVQVVGGDATVRAVAVYLLEYQTTYVDLLFERAALMQLKMRSDALHQIIDRALADQTRWTQAMQQANVEEKTSPQLWGVLEMNFDTATKQFNERTAERAALNLDLGRRQVALADRGIQKVRALTKFITPMLLAVRDELELPIDKDAYLHLVEEADKRTAVIVKDMVSRLGEFVEKEQVKS